MKKYLLGVGTAAVLALSTACGGDDTTAEDTGPNAPATKSDSAKQGNHNESDIAFARQMIPHHQQAVDMSDMAPTRSSSPEVKDLAERITDAQGPEIQQMNSLLQQWGAPPQPTDSHRPSRGHGPLHGRDHDPMHDRGHGHTPGRGHGPMHGRDHEPMPGMMSQDEMRQLEQASGSEFDTMWLQMM